MGFVWKKNYTCFKQLHLSRIHDSFTILSPSVLLVTEIIACNIRYMVIIENTSFLAVIKLKQIVFKVFKIICSHLLIQNLKDLIQ